MARAVSERMRHYYARRVATFARQAGRHSAMDISLHLEPAPWTLAPPVTWLPDGLDEALINVPINLVHAAQENH